MPRGRRRAPVDANALEAELAQLQERQKELRQQIRQMRSGQNGISKLEEKLGNQLGSAKWIVQQIKALQPEWDELGFYQSVQAQQPKPRGRRPRAQVDA